MHDLPDLRREDTPDIHIPELEAAQVGKKRIYPVDDHGCIDSYIMKEHRRYDECA